MKKEEEQKKSKNKNPGKCKGKSETSTNKEDAKRLKKIRKRQETDRSDIVRHSTKRWRKNKRGKRREWGNRRGLRGRKRGGGRGGWSWTRRIAERGENEDGKDEKNAQDSRKIKKFFGTKPQNSRNDLRINMDWLFKSKT